jgi:cytochrome c-type biogenesis protein CcsB
MTTLLKPLDSTQNNSVTNHFKRPWHDWVFALTLLAASLYWGWQNPDMDIYDQSVLAGASLGGMTLAWAWRPLQGLVLGVTALSLLAVSLYSGHQFTPDTQPFLLKTLLSSQSAILWMCVCFVMSLSAYWIGLLGNKPQSAWTGTALAWLAIAFGFTGLMVRWYESHLLGADIGHIPVSNLYEVFILFALLTTAFYLYYEAKYATRALGGFVMLVVVAAVVFLLWYSIDRKAHAIAPLVPALQSWWMKIHVPANFIGYGTFSLSAMVAFAYLIKHYATPLHTPALQTATNTHTHAIQTRPTAWAPIASLFVLGILLLASPIIFRKNINTLALTWWVVYFGVSSVIVAGILAARHRIAKALPSFEVLDDIMYKAIAVGFAFFTVATILGALWAADAWGTYWQWDPKETWALIVWLNYAAWLHLRFIKGMRGVIASYWALMGLLITSFAFLGVNMWLSGLHSYGAL